MVVIKDCTKMFWGVAIDAGKRYTQVVKQGFHVSMAALERNSLTKGENVQVMLQHESNDFLLCTLHNALLQQPLDLNFATGEEVSFSLNGSGVVHLTGFLIPDEEEPDFSDSDDEEVPSLVEIAGNSRKLTGNKQKSHEPPMKKRKLSDDDSEEADADEFDSEDEDDEDESEEEEGFSDDFEDDSFGESDSEGEEEISPNKKKQVKSPGQFGKGDAPSSQKKNKADKQDSKPAKSKQQASTPTPESKGNKEELMTPANGENDQAKKKKKKKKKKKNKDEDKSLNESASSQTSTPTTPKVDTTPHKKRVVAGGTIVEDLKAGHGPEAKPGKMVSVYYVGTLAKNNKRFDSCSSGKPFRFRLNQGEVIKGWDNGVNGMKVGGKRKITVPANQGYGNVKQGPIPPNSTLIFEVELKAVS